VDNWRLREGVDSKLTGLRRKVRYGMRWDALFDDLERQANALSIAELAAEITDRTRSEVGRLGLLERLRPAVGSKLRVVCRGELTLSGRLARIHPDWLLLAEGSGREALLALSAVLSVGGLSRLSAAPDSLAVVDSRLSLPLALRGIARDRSPVRMHLLDGTVLDGTPDRVGADFVELALHPAGEQRRRSAVSQLLVVATEAVVAVRRDG
jgi:hypothetical protein